MYMFIGPIYKFYQKILCNFVYRQFLIGSKMTGNGRKTVIQASHTFDASPSINFYSVFKLAGASNCDEVCACLQLYRTILKNCHVKPQSYENKNATSALISTHSSPAVHTIYVICSYFIQTRLILAQMASMQPKNALFWQVLLNFYVENGLWTQVDGLIWQKTSYSRAVKENLR